MNTKIFTLIKTKSLLLKLALIALLLIGGGNCAWAQETLTINDGSTTDSNIPISGKAADKISDSNSSVENS